MNVFRNLRKLANLNSLKPSSYSIFQASKFPSMNSAPIYFYSGGKETAPLKEEEVEEIISHESSGVRDRYKEFCLDLTPKVGEPQEGPVGKFSSPESQGQGQAFEAPRSVAENLQGPVTLASVEQDYAGQTQTKGFEQAQEAATLKPLVETSPEIFEQQLQEEIEVLRKEREKREPNLSEELSRGKEIHDIKNANEWINIVQKCDKPVVIDFYKHNSSECRRIYPKLLDKLKDSKENWVLVGADVENMQDLARNMRVHTVPAVYLIHHGKVLDSVAGDDFEHLENLLDKASELAKEENKVL
jgi:thiol-disulfide isomerase/thioredoxin